MLQKKKGFSNPYSWLGQGLNNGVNRGVQDND